ncbi:unnamed protein product [Prorocentrum cordatum]|uniref:Alpha-1,2-Mannosidase n=1 Tax=Prorocentrum cordatum TaxID=2364126 RepID=A0ABN9VCY0_9DINO|nr:unnamed protein product [Polarella glacialis]
MNNLLELRAIGPQSEGCCPASAPGRPPARAAALLWDARTAFDYSRTEVRAFGFEVRGRAPGAVRGPILRGSGLGPGRSAGRGAGFARLAAAHLAEEADLARRQAAEMMSWGGLGQTLVDAVGIARHRPSSAEALDTLWLMGLREDENVNLFETSIRHLGGLVAAYGLSGRRGLLAKAEDLAGRLAVAYSQPEPATETLTEEEKGEPDPGVMGGLLHKLLGGSSLEGAEEERLQAALESLPAEPMTQLPYSDVNLRTGQLQNLAHFTSLAEAYVPVEWKALALFTGNCTYASLPDEVLRIVNSTAQLETRGLAPISGGPTATRCPRSRTASRWGAEGIRFTSTSSRTPSSPAPRRTAP